MEYWIKGRCMIAEKEKKVGRKAIPVAEKKIGCKIYLNESDYNHLRKWAMYQDIICILVERDDIYIPKNSNKYILDRDICIIH